MEHFLIFSVVNWHIKITSKCNFFKQFSSNSHTDLPVNPERVQKKGAHWIGKDAMLEEAEETVLLVMVWVEFHFICQV